MSVVDFVIKFDVFWFYSMLSANALFGDATTAFIMMSKTGSKASLITLRVSLYEGVAFKSCMYASGQC